MKKILEEYSFKKYNRSLKWKKVFNGFTYYVNEIGDFVNIRFGKVYPIAGSLAEHGSPVIQIYKDGIRVKAVSMSTIFYKRFIGDLPEGYEVFCLDKDRTNLRPDNLVLVHESERTKFISKLYHDSVYLGRPVTSKLSKKQVRYIRNPNRKESNNGLARRYGISFGYIRRIIRGVNLKEYA